MEIVQAVLTVVKHVIEIVEAVAVNKKSCQCLAEQWKRMQTPLKNAHGNLGPSHVSALRAMEQLGHETIKFMTKFTERGFLKQAWSETKDKEKILELGQRLAILIQELQLGIVVDASAFQKNMLNQQSQLARQHDADVQQMRQLSAQLPAVLQRLDQLQGAFFGPGQQHEKQMQEDIMRHIMHFKHQQHQGDVKLGHGQAQLLERQTQLQAELMTTLKRMQQDESERAHGQAKLMAGQTQLQDDLKKIERNDAEQKELHGLVLCLLQQQQHQMQEHTAQQRQAYILYTLPCSLSLFLHSPPRHTRTNRDRIHTHKHIPTHTHTHTHKHTHTSTHTQINTHKNTQTQTHTKTPMHAHKYTHTLFFSLPVLLSFFVCFFLFHTNTHTLSLFLTLTPSFSLSVSRSFPLI